MTCVQHSAPKKKNLTEVFFMRDKKNLKVFPFFSSCLFSLASFSFVIPFALSLAILFSLASCSKGSSGRSNSNASSAEEDPKIITEEEDCPTDTLANGVAKRSRSGAEDASLGEWSACVPKSCDADFYLLEGACEPVGASGSYSPATGPESLKKQQCTNGGADVIYTGTGSGENNCPFDCPSDYQKDSGACVSDTKDCSVEIVNGQGEKTWSGGSYGACSLTGCDEGYYSSDNTTCVEVSPGSVSGAGDKLQIQCRGSTIVNITKSACVTCSDAQKPNTDHTLCENLPPGTTVCSISNGEGLSTNGGACTLRGCDEGYYSSDSTTCVEVDAGQISVDGALSQVPCHGNRVANAAKGACIPCNSGEHTEDHITCVSNVAACDILNGDGEQTWNKVSSAWNDCQPTRCDTDFYRVGSSCVTVGSGKYSPGTNPGSLGTLTCTNAGDDATYTYTGSGSGENNCPFDCTVGYHKEGGACVSNTQDCSLEIANGDGEKTWSVDDTDYGDCSITGCNEGYYKPLSVKTCVEVSPGSVSGAGDVSQRQCSGNTIPNGAGGACAPCLNGERANSGHTACEAVTDVACDVDDGAGSSRNSGPCEITGCNAGFYKKASDCVAVDGGFISEAGSLDQVPCKGNDKANAKGDDCESCSSNQHTEDNIDCVANTRSCVIINGVGEQTWNTDTSNWNTCQVVSCGQDFYENNNACVTVGNGFYSVDTGTGNLLKKACTNGGNNVAYTSSGGGDNHCTYACKQGFQKNKSDVCIAIQNRDCSTLEPHGVASGTQRYNPLTEAWEGSCTIASCHEDFYLNTDTNHCEAVGDGYYSPNTGDDSLNKLACGNLGGVISGGTFTSDGGGEDSCSFTCDNDQHKNGTYTCTSNTAVCSIPNGVGQKTWNPTLNSNAGDWNACQIISCIENFYKTGTGVGVCTQVAEGEYSGASSTSKGTCTNKPSESKYTGRGGGSATGCSWACDEGYWKDSSISCDLTPEGYYSLEKNDAKVECSNSDKPASDAHYTRKGEASQNCEWECDSGFVLDNGSCVNSNTLANIGNIQWESFPDKPAEASYDFSSQFMCIELNDEFLQGTFDYKLYLRKVWLVDENDVEERVFYHHTRANGADNLIYTRKIDTRIKVIDFIIASDIAVTNAIMSQLNSQTGAFGIPVPYAKKGGMITFTAPEGTGAIWNGKRIKIKVETNRICKKLRGATFLRERSWPNNITGRAEVSFTFSRGLRRDTGATLSKGVLAIPDCFKANGSNNSITIDGVVIPFGSSRLTRLEIAQKIASTNFSLGTTYSTNPYSVTSNSHGEVIFTLNTGVTSSISIPIADFSYTKQACNLRSCGEDYYLSDGFCVPVGNGYYSVDSGASSVNRVQCNNTNGGTITNGQFTGSGGAGDSCPFSCHLGYHKDGNAYACVINIDSCDIDDGGGEKLWDPRINSGDGEWGSDCFVVSCDADFYKQGNGCVAVAEGEYSVAGSLNKRNCTGKPAHSKYTSDGGGLASGCSWACDGGYWKNSSTNCRLTPRGFYSGEKDNDKRQCSPVPSKPALNVYTQKGEQTAECTHVLGSRSCTVANGVVLGTQTWNIASGVWDGICTIDSCHADFYKNGDRCVAVGNGYYSVASGSDSLNRVDCGGKSGSITNGQFTSSGRGDTNNCSFTCNSNYHQSINDAYTCETDFEDCQKGDGTGRKTWDVAKQAFGVCEVQSCEEDYYRVGDSCEAVEDGFYSLDSGTDSLKKESCINRPYKSEYTSSGSGLETGCSWACDAGYYEKGGACVLTPFGDYSVAGNNDKLSCNTSYLPENVAYSRLGESTDVCSWKCLQGYILSDNKTCVQDSTLAGIDSFLTFELAYTPASLSFNWTESFFDRYNFNCADPIYLQRVSAVNSDGGKEFIFYDEKSRKSVQNIDIYYLEDQDTEWYNEHLRLVPELLKKIYARIDSRVGAMDSGFRITYNNTMLNFKAPSNTGAEWNGRKVQLQSVLVARYIPPDPEQEYSDCRNFQSFELPTAFSGGSSAYEPATLEISECFAASAVNHTLTIDGVTIDLGGDALSTSEIAAAIAVANFSTGTLYQNHAYTVAAVADNSKGGSSVTFTLDSPPANPTQPLRLEVDDSSYTKVSCSDSSVTSVSTPVTPSGLAESNFSPFYGSFTANYLKGHEHSFFAFSELCSALRVP